MKFTNVLIAAFVIIQISACKSNWSKISDENHLYLTSKNGSTSDSRRELSIGEIDVNISLQTSSSFGSKTLYGHNIDGGFMHGFENTPEVIYVDSFALKADSAFRNYYWTGSSPLFGKKVNLAFDDHQIDSIYVPPALMVDYSSAFIGLDSLIRWNAYDKVPKIQLRLYVAKGVYNGKNLKKNIVIVMYLPDTGEWKFSKEVIKLLPKGADVDISMSRIHHQYIRMSNNKKIHFSSYSTARTMCSRN